MTSDESRDSDLEGDYTFAVAFIAGALATSVMVRLAVAFGLPSSGVGAFAIVSLIGTISLALALEHRAVSASQKN